MIGTLQRAKPTRAAPWRRSDKGGVNVIYTIMITQTLRGYVEIEAPDDSTAVEIATRRFERDGEQLPDMDDLERLIFEPIAENE